MRKEIEVSGLTSLGKLQAYRVWETLKGMVQEKETSILPTDDHGLVLEFTREGRDLLFAVPEDGTIIYYTARGENGLRHSGVISEDFHPLLHWSLWLVG